MFILVTHKRRSALAVGLGKSMKVKRVLRFYFCADSLDRAFDNLILNSAYKSVQPYSGETYGEKICALLEEKHVLSKLYGYLDAVLEGITGEDRRALESYAQMRCGIKKLDDKRRKEIKRAAMKFKRHARRLESFEDALRLINKYYALI